MPQKSDLSRKVAQDLPIMLRNFVTLKFLQTGAGWHGQAADFVRTVHLPSEHPLFIRGDKFSAWKENCSWVRSTGSSSSALRSI